MPSVHGYKPRPRWKSSSGSFSCANARPWHRGGIVSYAALKLLTGRPRDAHPALYVLAVLLCLYYAFG